MVSVDTTDFAIMNNEGILVNAITAKPITGYVAHKDIIGGELLRYRQVSFGNINNKVLSKEPGEDAWGLYEEVVDVKLKSALGVDDAAPLFAFTGWNADSGKKTFNIYHKITLPFDIKVVEDEIDYYDEPEDNTVVSSTAGDIIYVPKDDGMFESEVPISFATTPNDITEKGTYILYRDIFKEIAEETIPSVFGKELRIDIEKKRSLELHIPQAEAGFRWLNLQKIPIKVYNEKAIDETIQHLNLSKMLYVKNNYPNPDYHKTFADNITPKTNDLVLRIFGVKTQISRLRGVVLDRVYSKKRFITDFINKKDDSEFKNEITGLLNETLDKFGNKKFTGMEYLYEVSKKLIIMTKPDMKIAYHNYVTDRDDDSVKDFIFRLFYGDLDITELDKDDYRHHNNRPFARIQFHTYKDKDEREIKNNAQRSAVTANLQKDAHLNIKVGDKQYQEWREIWRWHHMKKGDALKDPLLEGNVMTRLAMSVYLQNYKNVKILLDAGYDPAMFLNIKIRKTGILSNVQTSINNNSALGIAAEKGDEKMVELLLSKGNVDVNQSSWRRVTHMAAKYPKILKMLHKAGADFNLRDGGYSNILHHIARIDDIDGFEIVQELIDANIKLDYNAMNADRETPLSIAVKKNDYDLMQLLVDKGASVSMPEGGNLYGQKSILHNINSINYKVLLSTKERINGEIPGLNSNGHNYGATPLEQVLLSYEFKLKPDGQYKIAKALLKAGANPNKLSDGRRNLTLAGLFSSSLNGKDKLDLYNLMKKSGLDLTTGIGYGEFTPAHSLLYAIATTDVRNKIDASGWKFIETVFADFAAALGGDMSNLEYRYSSEGERPGSIRRESLYDITREGKISETMVKPMERLEKLFKKYKVPKRIFKNMEDHGRHIVPVKQHKFTDTEKELVDYFYSGNENANYRNLITDRAVKAKIRKLLKKGDFRPTLRIGSGDHPLLEYIIQHNIYESKPIPADVIKKIDINAVDFEGRNVLFNLWYWKNLEMYAKQLVKAGIDINKEDIYGLTPLRMHIRAANFRNRQIPENFTKDDVHNIMRTGVKLLLENGADPNQKDINGSTVLHYSLLLHPPANMHLDNIKLLLDHGADPNAFSRMYGHPINLAGNQTSMWRDSTDDTTEFVVMGKKVLKMLLEAGGRS